MRSLFLLLLVACNNKPAETPDTSTTAEAAAPLATTTTTTTTASAPTAEPSATASAPPSATTTATATATSTGTGTTAANKCVAAGGVCKPITPKGCGAGLHSVDANQYPCAADGAMGVMCCMK